MCARARRLRGSHSAHHDLPCSQGISDNLELTWLKATDNCLESLVDVKRLGKLKMLNCTSNSLVSTIGIASLTQLQACHAAFFRSAGRGPCTTRGRFSVPRARLFFKRCVVTVDSANPNSGASSRADVS